MYYYHLSVVDVLGSGCEVLLVVPHVGPVDEHVEGARARLVGGVGRWIDGVCWWVEGARTSLRRWWSRSRR